VLAGATGAVVAFLAIAAPGAPGGAASACSASAGVTVIVDFTHFGGVIERGCAGGQPATALAAIQSAGFHTAGTANYGDAFICRIDGLPSPKSEACATTPPGNASWSFYLAKPSDRAWTYSTAGVTSFHPAPGSVLAFAFGNYAKPSVLPSGALPTHPTTPTPTSPPAGVAPTSPRVTAEVGTSATASVSEPVRSTSPTTSASTASATPTRPPSPASTIARTTSTTQVLVIEHRAARSVPSDSSGSPIPAFLTVALVAILGAGALVTIRSRRGRST
jgi:hypothetical protein